MIYAQLANLTKLVKIAFPVGTWVVFRQFDFGLYLGIRETGKPKHWESCKMHEIRAVS
jgi:hypothetical protein